MASNTWYKEGTDYAAHREKRLNAAKEWYRANRERVREANRQKRIAHAGAPPPAACTICAREQRLVWDHCHASGRFRGWLCYSCNIALGQVRDDVGVLQRMIEYLDSNREKAPSDGGS